MADQRPQRPVMEERRAGWVGAVGKEPLASILSGAEALEVGLAEPGVPDDSQDTVVALFRLQDAADYRATLRGWFRPVRIGGHLVVVVPHAFLHERQLALPSRWDAGQRRLYTPRSLLEEVEEALAPNSYRVRHLGDLDEGYDYALDPDQVPVGHSDIVLVLGKIATPRWTLSLVPGVETVKPREERPDYEFEPPATRVEVETRPVPLRILLLKLDHLGDFIMGLATLERARAMFPEAELTLVVGSWNAEMARGLGLFDHVIPFDVFPRNSSEEEVDVPGKAALFRSTVTGEYDLAIDLRTDHDTRFLLRLVRASLRAGIGTRAQFRFLDIFLPIDWNRNEPETAREFLFNHYDFKAQGSAFRSEHRVVSRAATTERDCAVVWGPYRGLRPGRYIFEPHLEIDRDDVGLLMLDVALDMRRVAQAFIDRQERVRLSFAVEEATAEFEFRIWAVDDEPALGFSFFGGRLIREGAASVLHQSEYGLLLLELVALRLARTGILTELDPA